MNRRKTGFLVILRRSLLTPLRHTPACPEYPFRILIRGYWLWIRRLNRRKTGRGVASIRGPTPPSYSGSSGVSIPGFGSGALVMDSPAKPVKDGAEVASIRGPTPP